MSKNCQLTNLVANACGDAITPLAASGKLCLYTGTQPATADTALSGNTLLATLTLNATAFGACSAGVLTANAITSGTAVASGTATWYRIYKSDGTTALMDGTVDVTGNTPNLVLNAVAISSGATVSASSFTHTIAKATSGY